MIRFSWRQFRAQGAVAGLLLVLAAIVGLVTGPHLVHLYDTTVRSCGSSQSCSTARQIMENTDRLLLVLLDGLVLATPLLIGMFWGAPLVARELEEGTFRLAFTQSVSRRRWILSKLALGGLASVAASGLVSLIVTWWASPLDTLTNPWSLGQFSMRDITPIGYGAFAFALGVALGAALRRSLVAMGLTILGFVTSRLVVTYLVRPQLFPALRKRFVVSMRDGLGFLKSPGGISVVAEGPPMRRAWVYSTEIVDKKGHVPSQAFLHRNCAAIFRPPHGPLKVHQSLNGLGGSQSVGVKGPPLGQHCIQALQASFHGIVTYQPAGRYWLFQGLETALFLLAALLVGLGAVYLVTKRIS